MSQGRPTPSSDPATIDLAATAAPSHRSLTTCNLYSTTTNQAAISALFRVVNRYVGNLAPTPRVFRLRGADRAHRRRRPRTRHRALGYAVVGARACLNLGRLRLLRLIFVAGATLAADPTPEDVIRTIAAAVAAKRRAETMVGIRIKLIGAARRA